MSINQSQSQSQWMTLPRARLVELRVSLSLSVGTGTGTDTDGRGLVGIASGLRAVHVHGPQAAGDKDGDGDGAGAGVPVLAPNTNSRDRDGSIASAADDGTRMPLSAPMPTLASASLSTSDNDNSYRNSIGNGHNSDTNTRLGRLEGRPSFQAVEATLQKALRGHVLPIDPAGHNYCVRHNVGVTEGVSMTAYCRIAERCRLVLPPNHIQTQTETQQQSAWKVASTDTGIETTKAIVDNRTRFMVTVDVHSPYHRDDSDPTRFDKGPPPVQFVILASQSHLEMLLLTPNAPCFTSKNASVSHNLSLEAKTLLKYLPISRTVLSVLTMLHSNINKDKTQTPNGFLSVIDGNTRRRLVGLASNVRSGVGYTGLLTSDSSTMLDDCCACALAVAQLAGATVVPVNACKLSTNDVSGLTLREALEAVVRLSSCGRPVIVLLPPSLLCTANIDTTFAEIQKFVQIAVQLGRNEASGGVLVIGYNVSNAANIERVFGRFDYRVTLEPPSPSQRLSICRMEASRLNMNEYMQNQVSEKPYSSYLGLLTRLQTVGINATAAIIAQEQELLSIGRLSKPDSTRNQVFGLNEIEELLREVVVWPRKFANIFVEKGMQSNGLIDCGVLLFGPPGTGKTMLPHAIASREGMALIEVRLTDVVRGSIGEGEKKLTSLFTEAKRNAPSLVFVDELQASFVSRDNGEGSTGDVGYSLSAALASAMDELRRWNELAGPAARVCVIAATNEPWSVDPSLIRAGRFGRQLFVGPLVAAGRRDFIHQSLVQLLLDSRKRFGISTQCQNEIVLDCTEIELASSLVSIAETLAQLTEGYTGADLSLLCRKLRRSALLEVDAKSEHELVGWMRSRAQVLKVPTPSVSAYELQAYQDWSMSRSIVL